MSRQPRSKTPNPPMSISRSSKTPSCDCAQHVEILKDELEAKKRECHALETRLREATLQAGKDRADLKAEMKIRDRHIAELVEAKEKYEKILESVERERRLLKEDNDSFQLLLDKTTEDFKKELLTKDQENRVLHNEVVDLRGQIRVALRIRPSDIEQPMLVVPDDNTVRIGVPPQMSTFKFEKVLGADFSQQKVFDSIKELILSSIHGHNVSLIAYGPTGSGKTHTMRGGRADTEGLIPRAIGFLFDEAATNLKLLGWNFEFVASFLEVYNEEVFDLLDNRKKREIKLIGDRSSSTTTVTGVHTVTISAKQQVDAILRTADAQRSTASTRCNAQSSRSHALFRVWIHGQNKRTGGSVTSSLSMVDLAGSERVKESGAVGERFTELKNINQSLSTLKRCIGALMKKQTHIPYRESKLTLLLRDSLGGGSSKTMFIAHVNTEDVSEMKQTLDFTANLRQTYVPTRESMSTPNSRLQTPQQHQRRLSLPRYSNINSSSRLNRTLV